ncbi:MAG: MFS transporter [Chloroflexota bacterium]
MTTESGQRQKIFYSFGQLANGAYNGLNNAVLGPFLSGLTSNPFIIGYLGNTRTMEGVVIQPLVGRWSDRTASPLGRRRPFILFGIPLSVLFLFLIPVAGHQSANRALGLVAAAIICFSITWNIAGDPYQTLMVDITSDSDRSIYNSILSVLALLGQVAIVALASFAALKKNNIPDGVFYAGAAFMFAMFALVFFGVREPRDAAAVAQVEEKIPFRAYVDQLRESREAFKLLVSIFFLWSGLNAILPFLTIIPTKIVGATTSQSLYVYMVMILVAAICSYPFGRLAARHGARPYIIIGIVMLIVAALLGVLVPSYIWFFPVAILAGAGFSATTALTYPYLSFLVPGSKMGVFTGLQTAFASVANPLSIAITGLLITHFSYRSTFGMLAVMMVFSVVVLLSIDEEAARGQVEALEREESRIARELTPVQVL